MQRKDINKLLLKYLIDAELMIKSLKLIGASTPKWTGTYNQVDQRFLSFTHNLFKDRAHLVGTFSEGVRDFPGHLKEKTSQIDGLLTLFQDPTHKGALRLDPAEMNRRKVEYFNQSLGSINTILYYYEYLLNHAITNSGAKTEEEMNERLKTLSHLFINMRDDLENRIKEINKMALEVRAIRDGLEDKIKEVNKKDVPVGASGAVLNNFQQKNYNMALEITKPDDKKEDKKTGLVDKSKLFGDSKQPLFTNVERESIRKVIDTLLDEIEVKVNVGKDKKIEKIVALEMLLQSSQDNKGKPKDEVKSELVAEIEKEYTNVRAGKKSKVGAVIDSLFSKDRFSYDSDNDDRAYKKFDD